MDLIHIEDNYVLHLVDEATRFSAAKFVGKRVTTEKVWEAIIQCWSSVYTGMPHTIAVDEGTLTVTSSGNYQQYTTSMYRKVVQSHTTLWVLARDTMTHFAKPSLSHAKIIRA